MVVAMEPWDGMRLPPAELFASLRSEIAETGRLTRQRLDVRALADDATVRWCREGEVVTDVRVDDDYLLAVKWPAFWRYLELLPETRFVVCLRHPVQTIASYRKAGGRLVQGLNYDTAFNRRMNAELDRATSNFAFRRVLLFDYIHSRIIPHLSRPNVLAVRYERWFDEPDGMLNDLGGFLGEELSPLRPHIDRPPDGGTNEEERELIRRNCTTADALGYSLG
jgi:hypothetical protein